MEFCVQSSEVQKGDINNSVFHSFTSSAGIFQNTLFSNIIFPQTPSVFKLRETTFDKCRFSNVDWGDRRFSETDEHGKDLPSGELKETYRMLKQEHDAIGNQTEAQQFFAREMEYYDKSLQWSWNDAPKKIVLKINKLLSNHGTDWLRATGWYVSVCSIVYFWHGYTNVYIFSIDSLYYIWFDPAMGDIFNPVPKFDNIHHISDLLFYVIKAILVYQIINAARNVIKR